MHKNWHKKVFRCSKSVKCDKIEEIITNKNFDEIIDVMQE